jgi:coenzyme F420-reducing hydrogenase alpha subunit
MADADTTPTPEPTPESGAHRIRVNALARVEGEGALTLQLGAGGEVERVELEIYEPPRFFEALLRGRDRTETPDITARICGICPVAYQMSACAAIEDACGAAPSEEIRRLRRLLYTGEWIQSHVLHTHLLHAPDFLGYQDAMRMAVDHGEVVRAGLRQKKAGNAIMEAVGGRAVHPVNVRTGGFYKAPARDALRALLPELTACRDLAEDALRFFATLEFPALERPVEMVALTHETDYAIERGRIASTGGLDITPQQYPEHFEEVHVPHSTALHAQIRGRGHYLCGPAARMTLNFEQLPEAERALARELGMEPPFTNPFRSILCRGLETVFAFREAIRLIEAYAPPAPPAAELPAVAGTGHGVTEAPRGLLYHRYRVAEDGAIEEACIIPPTSQNQPTIEDDLRALGPELAAMDLEAATWRAEQAIRNYDPCISCATHFLRMRVVASREEAR